MQTRLAFKVENKKWMPLYLLPCGALIPNDCLSWLQCLSVPETDTLAGIHTSPTLKVQTVSTATPWRRQNYGLNHNFNYQWMSPSEQLLFCNKYHRHCFNSGLWLLIMFCFIEQFNRAYEIAKPLTHSKELIN